MPAEHIFTLLGIFVVSVVPVMPLVVADRRNHKRTTCRCCGGKLAQPGGVGFFPCGMGFCKSCRAAILRRPR